MIKNNNHIKMLDFFIILNLLLINACTVYYKTSDVRKTFSNSMKETSKAIEKAEKDKNEKQEIYDQLVSNIPDPSMDPYPSLASAINEMAYHISMLYEMQSYLDSLNNEFDLITGGKKKVESNKPEWKKFKAIKAEFERASKEMGTILKKYSQASNSSISIANNYKIAKVTISDIKSQVYSYLKNLDTSVRDIEEQITKNRGILANAQSQGASQKKIKKKQEIFNQLESIVAAVNEKRKEIGILIEKFEDESGKNIEIWSGPGMITHTLLSDITKLGDDITQLGKQFNEISKRL